MSHRISGALAVLALACGLARAQTVEHVVVFGVDGLAARAIDKSRAPNMVRLMERGSWTLRARSVIPTVSSPNWSALIAGAGPDFTGVTSNDWQPNKFEIAPFCHDGANHPPTIFGVIRKAKPALKTALFTDWPDFVRLVEPLAASKVFSQPDDAGAVVRQAASYLIGDRPTLLFIHVDNVDHAGHQSGWFSPKYLMAVHTADDALGSVLAAIDKAGLAASTVVLLVADHGGHDAKHGAMQQSDIEVPWIAMGPGVPSNREIKSPVSVTQTAPTIAAWLGLPANDCWVARPVAGAMGGLR
ncbi:MAG: alkaline phosphatase [Acidobacteria bacterium]|nr:alkaline phosphatase [Acidobacteriota bacterium]